MRLLMLQNDHNQSLGHAIMAQLPMHVQEQVAQLFTPAASEALSPACQLGVREQLLHPTPELLHVWSQAAAAAAAGTAMAPFHGSGC